MKGFPDEILAWYESAHRKLPWRLTRDPYLIWLSEIILQQTRVSQGIEYYLKFADKYPRVEMLAQAPEDEVLKLWQGLGYYSRARNMLFAARQVVDDFDGHFPPNYKALLSLRGVGEYTAAAIASIAFGEAVPVVDGNVKRVMARIFGLEAAEAHLHEEAKIKMAWLMNPQRPGDFNQAVMEFGALICTPRTPACASCLFRGKCKAYKNGTVHQLPMRQRRREPALRYFSYLVILYPEGDGSIIFKKRSQNDIWKNLYDFPLIESSSELTTEALIKSGLLGSWFRNPLPIGHSSKMYKHQLTHRQIMARFHMIKLHHPGDLVMQPGWENISRSEIHRIAVPRLIENYIIDHPAFFNQ